ncbi:hypothetical protein E4634_14040 [Mangrovimicrobium sediminis]|uniref:Uncharacterized protein n=1 Tax=Mangrovimicrobium sediminis TaxID=2562682 RepID=A0A4Z0LZE6_9GAMM|nr:hypothetical protein [Haliea sp. SAOS-164]TGD72639.1 hypothetical protein E4634_14040 [Haliea sp. SAOS-164]
MDRAKSVWEATYQSGSTKLEVLIEENGINQGAGTSEIVNTPADDGQLLPFQSRFDEECLNFIIS